MVLPLLLLPLLLQVAVSENVGWQSYLVENPTEFHDLPLSWEMETPVPSWMSGTYVRNGPAQISFGSERRVFSSWLEGFAKLHSFKMDGENVLYSGKMVESPNYVASVANGELVPMLTLNKFNTEEEEWTTWEKMQIVGKSLMGTEFGNNNPALWRIGPNNQEEGIYMAVTDSKVPTRFNISDLSTIGQEYPDKYPITLTGCAHWMREPGTDNSINFQMKKGLTGPPWVEVQRYRPEDTYQTPQVVATFTPTRPSYIHSFSVTENYVIFFFYPVIIDSKKIFRSNFHVFELFDGGNKTDLTDIFVVHLKSGQVDGPFKTGYAYSAHHANAYEKSKDELVVDLNPTPFENLREYLRLVNMLNPPAAGEPQVSTAEDQELTRYTINTATGKVDVSQFPNTINSRYINTFDFPMINEDYRGKKYCILYGLSAFGYSRTAFVKKNVCDSSKDKVWHQENHYGSEMSFIPNPDPKSEDDGVLVTIVFDGERERSYYLVLDAVSFTPINRAYLQHNIPWSAHGLYFPEANFPSQSKKVPKKAKSKPNQKGEL